MKLGSHINLLGTIGTASILLWGLSQSRAKPEYSPAYIQVQTAPRPDRKAANHLAPKPRRILTKRARRLVEAVAAENTSRPREFAAIEPREPVYQLASKESTDGLDNAAATNEAPIVRNAVGKALPQPIKGTRRLIENVTVKNLCKLRKYSAIGPKELASKQSGDGMAGPVEVEVTPFIQKIMNKARPKQLTGTIKVEGKEYAFGSGGHGQSIPYGDYLITPDAIGSWGSRHGAIGVANGSIPDPKLHRDRDGIELHAATNDKLETDGCVSIKKDQWPEFRKQVLAMARENKKIYLHVSDQGASVSTTPLEFIGEAISGSIFRDVLSMIEDPPTKVESDRPTIRHHARSRRAERHARQYGSCGHECRRRHAGDAGLRS